MNHAKIIGRLNRFIAALSLTTGGLQFFIRRETENAWLSIGAPRLFAVGGAVLVVVPVGPAFGAEQMAGRAPVCVTCSWTSPGPVAT